MDYTSSNRMLTNTKINLTEQRTAVNQVMKDFVQEQ
jgi:hypothetical protein